MRYQGSWRNTSGFGIGIWFGIVLFVFMPFIFGDWRVEVIPVVLLVYLFGLSLLSVEIEGERLVVRTWLRRVEFEWREINSIMRASNLPWPRNHFYGPSTYEIRSGDKAIMLNLLYFPLTFNRSFLQRARQEKLLNN